MKRILTVQDISCFGKCSLTIALPVLSALGIETVILPTAILSTHTMFKNFTYKDLSSEILKIVEHWQSEGIEFDAIYSGYLGTPELIDLMLEVIKRFPNAFVFVDPVMGDNGKLYTRFDMEYVKKNTELCAVADLIVPNITEAAFLTGLPYREEYDESYIKELLLALNAKASVISGVSLEAGKTGVMGYAEEFFSYQNKKLNAYYHGTGDLFASVAVGKILQGYSYLEAFQIAADYTAHTIDVTMRNPKKPSYGVDFESTLKELW